MVDLLLLMNLMSKAEKVILYLALITFIVLLFAGYKHDKKVNDWCNERGGQLVKVHGGYKCFELKEIK